MRRLLTMSTQGMSGSMLRGSLVLGSNGIRALVLPSLLVLLVTLPGTWSLQSPSDPREYCQSEKFTGTCWRNEVILMETAKYGRMQLGRCVKADLGYIGCSRDVIELADRWCSGRRQCDVPVPNEELDNTKPCFKELKTYLLASYSCVKVATAQKSLCDSSNFVKLVSTEGYLASIVTTETGCGSANTPWIIQTDPGQRVNMTLLDFSLGPDPLDRPGITHCAKYAIVRERTINRTSVICGGGTRDTHAYLSTSNSIEVVMAGQNDGRHFLLKYETVGCSDLDPPPNAWFRRTSVGGIVGCKNSERSWHLACEDNQWVGVFGNCTDDAIASKGKSKTSEQILELPYGLSVAIIIGIALAIGLLILAFGLICFAKNRFPRRRVKKQNPGGSVTYKVYEKAPSMAMEMQGGAAYVLHHHNPVSINGNEYSHIWESPLPEPLPDGTYREALYAGRCECAYQKHDACLTRISEGAAIEDEPTLGAHCSKSTCKPVPSPKAPCLLADDPTQLCESRRFVTFEPREGNIIDVNNPYNPDVIPPASNSNS